MAAVFVEEDTSCQCKWIRAAASDLGVEEFGEAWVVGHILEVGVGAGLDAVPGVEADGLGEVFEAEVGVAGHAGEDSQAIEGVVGLVVFGDLPLLDILLYR